jgi:hypothetical protein
MDSWFDWLWNACVPVVKKVLGSLGMGYLSFEGASSALQSAFDSIQTSFGGLIPEVASLLARAGFFDVMAITSGGIMSGLAWMVLKRWAVVGTGAEQVAGP